MEPLQSVSMPTHGVVISINTQNSWPAAVAGDTVRMAYIATNSADQLSFVSLRSATHAAHVLSISSRPSRFEDMSFGLVVEVHLVKDIANGDTISIAVAQAGATTYYPPQQIDDTPTA